MADSYRGNQPEGMSDDSDLSFSFDSYGKTIDNNSKSIRSNSAAHNKTTTALGKLEKTINDCSKRFESIMRGSSLGSGSGSSSSNGNSNKNGSKGSNTEPDGTALRDLSKSMDRNVQSTDKALTMTQKTSATFIASLKAVGGQFIKEFKDSVGRVSDSYIKHLSSVTVRMSMSRESYGDMYKEVSQALIDAGLNRQFSPVDYAEAMETVLEAGLRGDEAGEVAYRNMITNKLVPALSTNTRAYIQLSKNLGGTFQEGITSIAKFADQNIGGLGIEEGQLNNVIETLRSDIMYQSNGDAALAQRMIDEITVTYSQVAQTYGQNVAEEFLSATKTQMTASPGEGTLAMTAGTNAVGQEFFNLWEKKGLSSIFDSWSGAVVNMSGDLESAQAISGDMGFSVDTYKDLVSGSMYTGTEIGSMKESTDKLLAQYKISDTYNKEIGNLQKDYYQSADAAIDKMEENLATGVSVWKSEIGRFDENLSVLKQILTACVTYFALTETKKLFSGGGSGDGIDADDVKGLKSFASNFKLARSGGGKFFSSADLALKQTLGTGVGTGKVGWSNLTAKGALSGIKSGVTGASSIGGAALNLAAGPGALIAGAIMAGKDAWDSGSKAAKDGKGAGTVIAQGVRGMVTGGEYMTEDEKKSATDAALRGEKRKMDWGAVGKNALKVGLVGAGVGTAVGGWAAGLGTVVGAGVGAITGAVASMVDQAAVNKKFNKLAEAVEDYNKVVEESTKAQEVYQEETSKLTDAESILESLRNEEQGTSESRNQMLLELQKQFPTVLGQISDESELTSEHLKQLEEQIRLERIANIKTLSDANDGLAAGAKKTLDGVVSTGASKKDIEFMSQFESEDVNGTQTQALQDAAVAAGFSSADDYAKHLNSLSSHGDVFVKDIDGEWYVAGSKDSGYSTAGDNIKQWKAVSTNTSDNLKDQTARVQSQLDTVISDMNQFYSPILQAYSQFAEEVDGKKTVNLEGWSETEKSAMTDNFSGFNQMYDDAVNTAKGYELEGYVKGLANSKYPSAKEVFEAFGQAPHFKTGTLNLSTDGPILAHKGEAVLTSSTAEDLRSIMSGGGVSGLFKGILGIMNSTSAAPTAETSITSVSVIDAIGHQTESIVGVLTQILDVVLRLSPDATNAQPAALSQSYVTFGTEV